MSDSEDGSENHGFEHDYVWAAVENGNVDVLKKFTPTDFDWKSLHPEHGVTPLAFMVQKYVSARSESEKFLAAAKWIVEQGADPRQRCGKDSEYHLSWYRAKRDDDEPGAKRECEILVAGKSAIAIMFAVKQEFERICFQNKGKDLSREQVDSMDALLDVIQCATSATTTVTPKLQIQEPVVEMWEAVWRDSESADLTIECEGGYKVKCHYLVVSKISDVLKAMVSSNMQEGISKKIILPDAPAPAVKLFLEICYCGSVADEQQDLPSLLSAVELAHRWHVPFAVEFLEKLVLEHCTEENFGKLAEVALLQELPNLMRGLKNLCRGSEALKKKFKSGEMTPACQKIGKAVWEAPLEGPRPLKKKRRTC